MKRLIVALSLIVTSPQFFACTPANSERPELIASPNGSDARAALERLYATTPGARSLGKNAAGILIFPEITKAGFVVGGQYGKGVLLENGKVAGYYRSTAGSYGLQAGVQKFGYALFFMNKSDLAYLNKSDGWEIGVGPSITVVDQGLAKSFTTTTARQGVYAFFFEQKGLMAGLGIQGTKITRTDA